MLKEPRKGGLGVSLVDAVVVEPGGHYCRSSDAAVLLCVRIIAPAAACVVCCGCGVATVNSGNGTEERETGAEGNKQRKDGAFLAFSLSAPHVGERNPFCCCRFPLILWRSGLEIQAPFLLRSKNQDKITLGFSGSCTPSPEALFSLKKVQKNFKISSHIESYDACMEH